MARGPVRDRSRGGSPHRTARAVLAVGVLAGLGYLAVKLAREGRMVGLDFRVYRAAAATALAGGDVYGTSPLGAPGMTFRYPPVVLLAFLPAVPVPWPVGYAAHTLATLLAGAALARLLVRYLERRGVHLARLDRVLVVAYVLGSAYAMPSLVYGQVNHFVALGLAAGVVWLDRGRQVRAGVALAVAAVPKVFPAAVGLWLVRRRARRALAAAVATGTGLLGLGLLLFGPARTRGWLTEALLARLATDAFAGGLSPRSSFVTLRRPLSVLAPGVDPRLYGVAAVVLLAPAVAILWRDVDGRLARPMAVYGLLAAVLLALPSYSLYLVYLSFPLVPLLYLFDGPGRPAFLAGALLVGLPLHLDDLAVGLALLPLAPGARHAVLAAARPVLAVAPPAMAGLVLSLAACVYRRSRERRVADAADGTEAAGGR